MNDARDTSVLDRPAARDDLEPEPRIAAATAAIVAALIAAAAAAATAATTQLAQQAGLGDGIGGVLENDSVDLDLDFSQNSVPSHGNNLMTPASGVPGTMNPQEALDTWIESGESTVAPGTPVDQLTDAQVNLLTQYIEENFSQPTEEPDGAFAVTPRRKRSEALYYYSCAAANLGIVFYLFANDGKSYEAGCLIDTMDGIAKRIANDDEYWSNIAETIYANDGGNVAYSYGSSETATYLPIFNGGSYICEVQFSASKVTDFKVTISQVSDS